MIRTNRTINALLPTGRIRRRDFFLSKLILGTLAYGSFAFFLIEDQNLASRFFYASIGFLIYLELILLSKRLHDSGYSAWWLLLLFVPIANIGVLGLAFINQGTVGENRFGPDPIKNRKAKIPHKESAKVLNKPKVDIMEQIERLKKEHDALK